MSDSDNIMIGKMILKLNDLRGKIKNNSSSNVSHLIKGMSDYITEEVNSCNAIINSGDSGIIENVQT
jgi:hypothetical protein